MKQTETEVEDYLQALESCKGEYLSYLPEREVIKKAFVDYIEDGIKNGWSDVSHYPMMWTRKEGNSIDLMDYIK